ncbi:MAG: hypothetical protein ABIF01_00550 [Candidatus Micrarchaeota archaeon]
MKEAKAEHKDDLEFANAISSLKKSETDAGDFVAKANSKAEALIKGAREKSGEIISRAQSEAVSLKDKHLLDSNKGIEAERDAILKKVEKEAGKLEKMKLKPEEIRKLANTIFE